LGAYRLTGEWNGDQTPFDDAISSSVEVTSSETSVRIDLASLLQGCVSAEDFGLLLRSSSEFSNISRIAFFSGEADSANRPRLAIYYTLPPGFRG